MHRIYMDNAATSFPKPERVWEAMDRFSRDIGASAGRGAYEEAFECGRLIAACRERLARLFNAPDPNRFLFTLNTTGALNLGMKGLLEAGDHVVATKMEHNSILRPLNALKQRGEVDFTLVQCAPTGEVDPSDIQRAIRPNTRLIATLHGSNVCGVVFPAREIARIAHEHGLPYLLDAAQTAGAWPIDVQEMGIDLLAFPGHKGLLGPLGTGALWVREGLDLRTVTEGGTGSVSEQDTQPLDWPDRHESGSHNALGIVGLSEGIQYLLERGVQSIRQEKERLTDRLGKALREVDGVEVFGPRNAEINSGVVSIRVTGWAPADFAVALDQRARINVRPGLHCAPGAHQTLGTFPEGTVRFSLGPFTTEEHVDRAAAGVAEIASEALVAGKAKAN